MDIQRITQKQSWLKKYWFILPLSIVIAVSVAAKSYLGATSFYVDKDELQFAQVEVGDFKLDVRGVGQLKPQNIQWVATQVEGRVEQLFVKPGNQVKIDQPLLKLSNPQLLRDLDTAHWELQAEQAEAKAQLVALESQLLDLENSIDEAYFNLKSTQLKLDAEKRLMDKGDGYISTIDFERTKLAVKQQQQKWLAQQQRAQKMRENISASKIAQNARIELVENRYHRVKAMVEQLIVKAPSTGTVQQVSLALGQQVNLGASVATIADPQSLYAELHIQELQIKNIALGQAVTIDTRSTQLAGKVSRIDPKVEAGMVTVDVTFTEQLPSEARPDLNIEGTVTVNHIKQALFVKRPSFAPSNQQVELFCLSEDGHFIERQVVRLGLSSVNQVQIIQGLEAGDTIVISDTGNYQQHQKVLIN